MSLIYKAIIVVLLPVIVAAYFYGMHNSKEKYENKINSLKQNNLVYISENRQLIADINEINTKLAEQKAIGEKYKNKFAAATIEISNAQKELVENNKSWAAKLKQLTNKSECSVLRETICEAAMGY